MARTGEPKSRIFTLHFIGIMAAELSLKLCNYMQTTLLPLYIIERGFPNTVAGLTSTAYMLLSLLLRPVSGKLADTKGRYSITIFGAAIYCVATGLYFFAVPVALLIVMRAVQGAGFGFDGTGIYALAADSIPENRMAEGIGYLGLAQASATALAPLAAIGLKNAYGYQAAFMVIFVLSVMTLGVILLLRIIAGKTLKPAVELSKADTMPVVDIPAKPVTFLSRIVNKDALRPSMIIFLILFASTTISVFLAPYATGGGIANPGVFFSVQAIMVFGVRLVMSKIQDRVGTTAIIVSGIMLIILNLVFLSLMGPLFGFNLPFLLICGAFYGIGIGVVQPQISAIAITATGKENRGMASSTFFMMMDMGTAASGFIFGSIADAAGYPVVYAIAAFVAICAVLLFISMRKRIPA